MKLSHFCILIFLLTVSSLTISAKGVASPLLVSNSDIRVNDHFLTVRGDVFTTDNNDNQKSTTVTSTYINLISASEVTIKISDNDVHTGTACNIVVAENSNIDAEDNQVVIPIRAITLLNCNKDVSSISSEVFAKLSAKDKRRFQRKHNKRATVTTVKTTTTKKTATSTTTQKNTTTTTTTTTTKKSTTTASTSKNATTTKKATTATTTTTTTGPKVLL